MKIIPCSSHHQAVLHLVVPRPAPPGPAPATARISRGVRRRGRPDSTGPHRPRPGRGSVVGIGGYNHEKSWDYHCKITGKSWENHWKIMGKSLENHGNIMGLSLQNHWKIMGISWDYHCKITGKSWEYHGNIMGKSWENHGKIMGKSWENHGNIMETWSPAKLRPVATWPYLDALQQAARSSEDIPPCGAPVGRAVSNISGCQHISVSLFRLSHKMRMAQKYRSIWIHLGVEDLNGFDPYPILSNDCETGGLHGERGILEALAAGQRKSHLVPWRTIWDFLGPHGFHGNGKECHFSTFCHPVHGLSS